MYLKEAKQEVAKLGNRDTAKIGETAVATLRAAASASSASSIITIAMSLPWLATSIFRTSGQMPASGDADLVHLA